MPRLVFLNLVCMVAALCAVIDTSGKDLKNDPLGHINLMYRSLIPVNKFKFVRNVGGEVNKDKRQVITAHKCPLGQVWVAIKCISCAEYLEYSDGPCPYNN